jgi:fatty-acid desaturase
MFAFRFWQIDPGGWFIRACERLGWAWEVKVPTPDMIASARLRAAGGSRG